MTAVINVGDRGGYRYDLSVTLEDGQVFDRDRVLWITYRTPEDYEIEIPDDLTYLPILGALGPIIACLKDEHVVIRSSTLKVPTYIRKLIDYVAQDRRRALSDYYNLDIDPKLQLDWEVLDADVVVRGVPDKRRGVGNFSFGKESNLIQILLEALRRERKIEEYNLSYSYTVGYSRSFYRKVLDKQSFRDRIVTINNNFNELNGYLNKINPNVWVDFQMFFQIAPLIIHGQYDYWLLGNEIDTTRACYSDAGSYMHWTLFDESIQYERLMTNIIKQYNPRAVAFSPISTIYENRILEAVCNKYGSMTEQGDYAPAIPEGLISCWFPKASNGGWCGECTKCERFYRMFRELGIKPPFEMRGKGNMLQNLTPDDLFSNASSKYYMYREMYMPLELVPTIRRTILGLLPGLEKSSEITYPPSGLYTPDHVILERNS